MKSFLLVGNPNTGKSTLFNQLTGLNQRVGNYPGVTVERKEGQCDVDGQRLRLIDLPGTYSLTPASPDEEIVAQILLGTRVLVSCIDGVIVVADATNLERNLYLTTQIIDCGLPVVLVVNMIDEARKRGIVIDHVQLSQQLGVPVVLVSAARGEGITDLKHLLTRPLAAARPLLPQFKLPSAVAPHLDEIASLLALAGVARGPFAEALRLISRDDDLAEYPEHSRPALLAAQRRAHQSLEISGIDCSALETESRYQWIDRLCATAVRQPTTHPRSIGDRLDALVTHRLWGPLIFLGVMAIVFQGLFSWASYPMDLIDAAIGWLSEHIDLLLPDSAFKSLLVDGALAGVGAVLVFLPQIMFLFLLIGLLEDSGYMARAAFVMDRLMARLGLHGKAFIPLVSSFACAIPGIMATRTIESKRDRLVTMMIAPLMSCSARLPVYTLLIAACIPAVTVFGIFNLQALTMWSLYMLGIVAAIAVAFVLKRTALPSCPVPFLMEMPPYRLPKLAHVLKRMWERSRLFVTNAGTVIFVLSLILWAITSYPKPPVVSNISETPSANALEYSIAGQLGKTIEPIIAPLGFNWQIGVGLIASFAAREVFVSSMAVVYNVQNQDDEEPARLLETLRNERTPDGRKIFTPLVGISLLVFYVLACQCMSTLAVVRRETNSWRWPIFMFTYMTLLAYLASLAVYQGGRLFGWS